MPEMQNMQPYFDAYQEEVRRAKNSSGLTLQELSDKTGVPYNNICTVNAGTMKQPLLYYSAATCKVLGLSLDKLFGLPRDDTQELADAKAVNHKLEIENACAKKDVEYHKRMNAVYRPLIFGLIGVCALLLCATIGYIFLDIRMTRVGLFQSAGMSALAVLLAVVVIAAIALMAYAAKMIIKNAKSPRD